MTFRHTVELPADRTRVWTFLMDVPRVAQCVPGLEQLEDLGDERYRATIKVKVGPIALALRSNLTIVERDAAAGRSVLALDADDKRAGGAVTARIEMTLSEKSSATTELTIVTDAQVLGKIGNFGQPIIRKKADQTVNEVGENLRAALAAGGEVVR
ncbi:MAG: SRPBCC family protein [Candidatus Eremiobacteraeota bacterium]|nr:SRPBCC family protein [Candidatus Eremiobacteraeota bacterium]MBV8354802.1 SRPBCC family protein [Candidatus Eremiobacteraeota bacterium]